VGAYDSNLIENPLLNRSQEACGVPYDFTPPCPPTLEVDPDCEAQIDLLSWYGSHDCSDDVMDYVIYWAPFMGDTLAPYDTLFHNGIDVDSTFIFNLLKDEGTIAGCFAITALDSLIEGPSNELTQNESELSNIVCVDNCPFYFMPNVFTPNDDLVNDTLVPLSWKFIESVDFRVYNRWGTEVFVTQDPELNWDGRDKKSGERLLDGVYFYTLLLNTIRLEGIIPEKFNGQIHIMGSRSSIND
tara:strand:- start:153 stop:881 length:729 start_codon:yes stop_codon:yes gene_type:complete